MFETGWAESFRTAAGRRAMEKAAYRLPPLPELPGATLELHLLTGRRFWYQTAFCLWTFAHRAGQPIAPVLYDDGTLDEAVLSPLRRLFPTLRCVSQLETIATLDLLLPASRFPVLRERWENYPNIRKLIDVHLGSKGWKLVIDSDLLFFRSPTFLLNWLAAPSQPLHALDCTESYGYSRELMEELAGAPIPPLVNVGLCGLRSDTLDWTELESWCETLIRRERTHYFLEQALVAMLMARTPQRAVAPAADYVTFPSHSEATAPAAVMHHYVSTSKTWYFRHNWRRVLPTSRSCQ